MAELAGRLRERGWLVLAGRLGGARRRRPAVRPDRRGPARPVARGRAGAHRGGRRGQPARARPARSRARERRPTLARSRPARPTGSRSGSSRASSGCSAGSATPTRSCSSSRTCTGPTARPATCWPSSPATARDERLFIVATFRTDELHRRHPLTGWLAEAERQPRVERIDLARFERDELVELIGMIAGDQLGPSLVESIARRSDGNAFFAEELVAAIDELAVEPRAAARDAARRPAGPPRRHDRRTRASPRRDRGRRRPRGRPRRAGRGVRPVRDRPEPAPCTRRVDAQLLFVDRRGRRRALPRSVTRSCRRRPTTSCCRPSGACSTAPTPARSRRGRPAAARRRPAGSWSSPTTGRRPRNRPGRCTPRSGPATRRGRSTPTPRRRASTSARSSCGTSCPRRDRPTDRDLADLFDSASVGGDRHRRRRPGGQPRPQGDRARRRRARRGRPPRSDGRAPASGSASPSWLAGDTATSIQLLEEAVDLLEGTPPSTEQARVLAGPGREPDARRTAARVRPVRRARDRDRARDRRPGIESRAMNMLGVDRASLGNIAAGIELLRRPLAIAKPVDDPTELPRAYANLGSVLEMGGFVEEALEVSPRGRRAHAALRQRAQLPDLPRGQRRGHADRAGAIPGGGRPARAPRCPTSCPASARSTCT